MTLPLLRSKDDMLHFCGAVVQLCASTRAIGRYSPPSCQRGSSPLSPLVRKIFRLPFRNFFSHRSLLKLHTRSSDIQQHFYDDPEHLYLHGALALEITTLIAQLAPQRSNLSLRSDSRDGCETRADRCLSIQLCIPFLPALSDFYSASSS